MVSLKRSSAPWRRYFRTFAVFWIPQPPMTLCLCPTFCPLLASRMKNRDASRRNARLLNRDSRVVAFRKFVRQQLYSDNLVRAKLARFTTPASSFQRVLLCHPSASRKNSLYPLEIGRLLCRLKPRRRCCAIARKTVYVGASNSRKVCGYVTFLQLHRCVLFNSRSRVITRSLF